MTDSEWGDVEVKCGYQAPGVDPHVRDSEKVWVRADKTKCQYSVRLVYVYKFTVTTHTYISSSSSTPCTSSSSLPPSLPTQSYESQSAWLAVAPSGSWVFATSANRLK